MKCTSPLFRVQPWLIEFAKGRDFPLTLKRKLHNKEYPIIGYLEACDYMKRYALPEQAFQEIPCGQCLNCRLNHSKEWAVRCMLEDKYSSDSYFVTLTYDDLHVPYKNVIIEENGLFMPFQELRKKDLQDFFKRLRKALFGNKKGNLRYFACGEYGDKTYRPHFHCILFNLPLSDLKLYKCRHSSNGDILYFNSAFLSKIWGKGFVVVSAVSENTCAYTARYALKKVDFTHSVEEAKSNLADMELQMNFGKFFDYVVSAEYLQKPFCVMSRRPGLGRDYFDENCGIIYQYDEIPGMSLRKLKYYDRLYDELSDFTHRELNEIKEKRARIAQAKTPYFADKFEEIKQRKVQSRIKRDKI